MSAFEGLKKAFEGLEQTLMPMVIELEQLRKENAELKKGRLWCDSEGTTHRVVKEAPPSSDSEEEDNLTLVKEDNEELLRKLNIAIDMMDEDTENQYINKCQGYDPSVMDKCNVCAIEIERESEDYDNSHIGEDMEITCQDCWHHYISTHDECPECDGWFESSDIRPSGSQLNENNVFDL